MTGPMVHAFGSIRLPVETGCGADPLLLLLLLASPRAAAVKARRVILAFLLSASRSGPATSGRTGFSVPERHSGTGRSSELSPPHHPRRTSPSRTPCARCETSHGQGSPVDPLPSCTTCLG